MEDRGREKGVPRKIGVGKGLNGKTYMCITREWGESRVVEILRCPMSHRNGTIHYFTK